MSERRLARLKSLVKKMFLVENVIFLITWNWENETHPFPVATYRALRVAGVPEPMLATSGQGQGTIRLVTKQASALTHRQFRVANQPNLSLECGRSSTQKGPGWNRLAVRLTVAPGQNPLFFLINTKTCLFIQVTQCSLCHCDTTETRGFFFFFTKMEPWNRLLLWILSLWHQQYNHFTAQWGGMCYVIERASHLTWSIFILRH